MLKGKAKTDYQRRYMRQYMRARRAEGYATSDFRIFERDGFRCQYCGKTPRDGIRLQIDHITPRCLGGGSEEDNLVTACAQCNGSKGGRLLRFQAEQAIRGGLNVKTSFDADGNPMPED